MLIHLACQARSTRPQNGYGSLLRDIQQMSETSSNIYNCCTTHPPHPPTHPPTHSPTADPINAVNLSRVPTPQLKQTSPWQIAYNFELCFPIFLSRNDLHVSYYQIREQNSTGPAKDSINWQRSKLCPLRMAVLATRLSAVLRAIDNGEQKKIDSIISSDQHPSRLVEPCKGKRWTRQ